MTRINVYHGNNIEVTNPIFFKMGFIKILDMAFIAQI